MERNVGLFGFSIILGAVIAIFDSVPMVIKRLPKYTVCASFCHFFIATVVIANTHIAVIPWWLQGGVLGFMLMLPMLIHIGHGDKKPLPIIAVNAILLGTVAKFSAHVYLG